MSSTGLRNEARLILRFSFHCACRYLANQANTPRVCLVRKVSSYISYRFVAASSIENGDRRWHFGIPAWLQLPKAHTQPSIFPGLRHRSAQPYRTDRARWHHRGVLPSSSVSVVPSRHRGRPGRQSLVHALTLMPTPMPTTPTITRVWVWLWFWHIYPNGVFISVITNKGPINITTVALIH